MAGREVRIDHFFTRMPSMRGVAVLVLMAPLATTLGGTTFRDRTAVRVSRIRTPSYVSFLIENHRAYDVTVRLTIHAENAQITRIVPETATCGGYLEVEAARVSRADPNKPWHWRYSLRWTKGRMDAHHSAETRYRLPFREGEAYRVVQGYNARWSHHGQDRYAVDFAMPEGTPVCAARDGVVVDLMESSEVGGPDRKYKDQANFVSIAHDDGTIGEYLHLKRDGVLVEVGAKVKAGQPIALSGNTGYSTVPHLHFGVYSPLDAVRLRSHPVTFVTGEGIVLKPIEGKTYTAR